MQNRRVILDNALDNLKLLIGLPLTETIVVDETTEEERLDRIRELTHGRGADVVVECTGSAAVIPEGLKMCAPLGIYATAGVATPAGEIPVRIYEDVVRKNVRLQGVWVSDVSHLLQAIGLIEGLRFPFDRLVDDTGYLDDATGALERMRDKKCIKSVLLPSEG